MGCTLHFVPLMRYYTQWTELEGSAEIVSPMLRVEPTTRDWRCGHVPVLALKRYSAHGLDQGPFVIRIFAVPIHHVAGEGAPIDRVNPEYAECFRNLV